MKNDLIFYVLFLLRLSYDLLYLYRDCLSIRILGNAILHSFIFAIIISGPLLSKKMFLIGCITGLIVLISQKMFSGCLLTQQAYTICGSKLKHKFYIKPKYFRIILYVTVCLYFIRFLREINYHHLNR